MQRPRSDMVCFCSVLAECFRGASDALRVVMFEDCCGY